MTQYSVTDQASDQREKVIFTILGGTTIADRAAIVAAHCREGALVELRRNDASDAVESGIDVWLQCGPPILLINRWKKIGYLPHEAVALLPATGDRANVVARGTVKSVYLPPSGDAAVVAVEIKLPELA